MSKVKRILIAKISRILSSVDKHSHVNAFAKLHRFTKIRNSTIGQFSYIGPRTKLVNSVVGSFCSISWDCYLGLASHPAHFVSTSPIFFEIHNGTGTSWIDTDCEFEKPKQTRIGNDVWIGANCIILEGVQIGHGAIVGVGSIVTKNVEPYSVVAGVPAKHIKSRFPDDIVQALLRRAWWDAPIKDIRSATDLFSEDIISAENILKLPDGRQGS